MRCCLIDGARFVPAADGLARLLSVGDDIQQDVVLEQCFHGGKDLGEPAGGVDGASCHVVCGAGESGLGDSTVVVSGVVAVKRHSTSVLVSPSDQVMRMRSPAWTSWTTTFAVALSYISQVHSTSAPGSSRLAAPIPTLLPLNREMARQASSATRTGRE